MAKFYIHLKATQATLHAPTTSERYALYQEMAERFERVVALCPEITTKQVNLIHQQDMVSGQMVFVMSITCTDEERTLLSLSDVRIKS